MKSNKIPFGIAYCLNHKIVNGIVKTCIFIIAFKLKMFQLNSVTVVVVFKNFMHLVVGICFEFMFKIIMNLKVNYVVR